MQKRIVAAVLLAIFVVLMPVSLMVKAESQSVSSEKQIKRSENEFSRIESQIRMNMKKGKIPGLSVVIIDGNKTVYSKGFGYSDTATQKKVTPDTLFELGSTSKAFTGLAVLKLEKEGYLNLSNPVSQYIPWFKMKFTGKHNGQKIHGDVEITLEQLLHHTSGIPFKSIGDIPASEENDALEQNIRKLTGKELDFYPGSEFLYATINYDILGLVIQQVTGGSYEEYIDEKILKPLGMNNTFLFREEAMNHDFSKGFKYHFLGASEYNAPMYRGNTPAGYIITNVNDLSAWLKFQLGNLAIPGLDTALVEASHVPDRTVTPDLNGSSYAAGWSVFQDGTGEIAHYGTNPNFSSSLIIRPNDKVGVAILANINTIYTGRIAEDIMSILQGEVNENDSITDIFKSVDALATAIVFGSVLFIVMSLGFLGVLVYEICRGKRRYNGQFSRNLKKILYLTLFVISVGFCLYKIPNIIFWELNWDFVKVWAPQSFLISVRLLLVAIVIFCLYYFVSSVYSDYGKNHLFLISVVSVLSGFGNSLIIFVINESLNREKSLESGLWLYFIAGIILYICGQKVVRTKLVTWTNELVYSKRVGLINGLLRTRFQKFETIENGKIHAGLNNDPEIISNVVNIIIAGVTNLVTLISCFLYMGMINFYGLMLSVAIILCAAGLYFIVGRSTHKLWEQTRDIQDFFFRFVNDLINGFKELALHSGKKAEFKKNMVETCDEYKQKRILGDINFANAFIVGELLFTFAIGSVAFFFPIIFTDMQNTTLRSYIFIFLYMTGPVNGLLNVIPQILRVKVSWRRLNEFHDSLQSEAVEETTGEQVYYEAGNPNRGFSAIELKNVEYTYQTDEQESFTVGPVNISFKPGEITFITGGNGSGKSTLAKLIIGLYKPNQGEILLNGQSIEEMELSQKYSAIFSDFYLFNKLYGIDYVKREEEIVKYLKLLNIDDKVNITDGVFSTTKLSTGQKKRLALLVSYLEDRPVYLFDEWAADQDPEFRKFFYNTLLIDLKNMGKCVIAITHDDRYFDIADQMVKLERGKALEQTEPLLVAHI
ncbi:cyclic peptide export ABC transporter [Paenibacillus sp. FSL M7-0420]|uniref:cyclic peptide export ABC transporter n=1 Tax=Paenibacillus sp. FSL M7-0420 TaxID=2921609 RepID=UPI0030F4C8EA